MLTPNELVFPFGGSYVCANCGENRSRNATVRRTDRQTDRLTDVNRLYNLSHTICYSYGIDNKTVGRWLLRYASYCKLENACIRSDLFNLEI